MIIRVLLFLFVFKQLTLAKNYKESSLCMSWHYIVISRNAAISRKISTLRKWN